MARYADIDVLLEHLTTSDKGGFRTAITQWLEMHQVEDVAPVIHAHWIETEDLSGNHYAECSNCCLLWWIDGESSQEAEMNYCPRCGAKMDEVINDA